jgi:amino acid transporter
LVFVLLTYGGWNEAAYLSGEVANPQRDMTRILFFGVGAVTALNIAANAAFLHVLGAEAAAKTEVVGAAVAQAALGPLAALLVTVFVAAASLSTMNGTLFTGARSGFALGRDAQLLSGLAAWDETRAAPRAAILVQSGVTLALVALGALTKQGFETMAAYTAPVFWAFFLLTGLAAIVLRLRDPQTPRPFRMPLYPLPTILFTLAGAWMLWSSLTYAGSQAFNLGVRIGVGVLALGVVVLVVETVRRRRPR